jgi:hypothetical protein
MDLGAACRTFNILVQEERQVVAALFSEAEAALARYDLAGQPARVARGKLSGRRHRGRNSTNQQSFEADRLERLHCLFFLFRLVALVSTPLLPVSSAGHPRQAFCLSSLNDRERMLNMSQIVAQAI